MVGRALADPVCGGSISFAPLEGRGDDVAICVGISDSRVLESMLVMMTQGLMGASSDSVPGFFLARSLRMSTDSLFCGLTISLPALIVLTLNLSVLVLLVTQDQSSALADCWSTPFVLR